ncbi:helix-turn-helix domain-containing protein [Hydromonas duriensis]|nr:helix-turn-helix transcriptional regulator [Hydromonas duriensis]
MMQNKSNFIGEQIRRIRKAKLLSQEVLSEKIGIDPKSLGRIEKGDYYPAIDTLMRLAVALEVSIKDFFPDDVKKSSDNPVLADIRHALSDFIYSADEQELLLLLLYKHYVKILENKT